MLYYVFLGLAIAGFVYLLVTWPHLPTAGKVVLILIEFSLLVAVIGYHSGYQLPTVI